MLRAEIELKIIKEVVLLTKRTIVYNMTLLIRFVQIVHESSRLSAATKQKHNQQYI